MEGGALQAFPDRRGAEGAAVFGKYGGLYTHALALLLHDHVALR